MYSSHRLLNIAIKQNFKKLTTNNPPNTSHILIILLRRTFSFRCILNSCAGRSTGVAVGLSITSANGIILLRTHAIWLGLTDTWICSFAGRLAE